MSQKTKMVPLFPSVSCQLAFERFDGAEIAIDDERHGHAEAEREDDAGDDEAAASRRRRRGP